jgi:hypothetical protein
MGDKITLIPTMILDKEPDNDITDYRIFQSGKEIGWVIEHLAISPLGYNKIAFLQLYPYPLSKEERMVIEKNLTELGFGVIYELVGDYRP